MLRIGLFVIRSLRLLGCAFVCLFVFLLFVCVSSWACLFVLCVCVFLFVLFVRVFVRSFVRLVVRLLFVVVCVWLCGCVCGGSFVCVFVWLFR